MMVVDGMSWGSYTSGGHEVRRGPALESQPYGWAPPGSPTREEEFIKGCSSNLQPVQYLGFGGYRASFTPSAEPKIDWQKVSMAMNCSQCHNGTVKGPLHSQFSFSEITFKTLVDRSMPPGFQLNADERIALLKCLGAEKSSVADKWRARGDFLKKDACMTVPQSGGPAAHPAPVAPGTQVK